MTSYYDLGKNIVKTLLDAGHQAFFVGGFVRDTILDIEAGDIDITTDATPKQVQALFDNTKATGLRFGTVTVIMDKHPFEVTTFRTEGRYVNHRKPETVNFGSSLEEDLERRDFTINAFAMDINGEIIDLYDGRSDLNQNLIRAIGNPDIRFHEDALRMLRAFRFVSKLGFDIEPNTFKSIQKNIHLLSEIANERVLGEWKKILNQPFAGKALRLLEESGIKTVFPELESGLRVLSKQKNSKLSIPVFFSLCFYLHRQEIPDRWRFSNKEKAIIEKIMELVLVTENDVFNELIIYRIGKEIPLMANQVSVLLGTSKDQEDLILKLYNGLPIKKTCDLAFKGQDILELTTLRNAEIIGEVIDDITYQIITKQLPNEYEAIKQYTLQLLETKYEER
ncbi:MAG: CCA tRNA nucleotidyltransferase [Bacilli bacterium]|nr:CCA tRNA nucleotidyltransferase [Bacilli bacterium]MBN2877294.1 CCA tRNA nucleotidyltransferase [Bacilli bacterium]